MKYSLVLLLIISHTLFSKSLWVGITFKSIPQYVEGEKVVSLQVDKLLPQSDAINSGIEPGDILIKVNGNIIDRATSVAKEIKGAKEGTSLNFELTRGSEQLKRTLKLTPRPENISQWVGSPIGSKAKNISGNFYSNKIKKISKPKLTLLDFWATWCGPCRVTLPIVADLYTQYSQKGFEVIGISTESLSVLTQFQESHSAPYPLLNDVSGAVSAFYGVTALPTLAFVDQDGYIVKVFTGAPSKAMLESVITQHLGN